MKSKSFYDTLLQSDPIIADLIAKESQRQENQIELIASENCVSNAILECAGSILTNKYAEGYPGKRYYGGCNIVDKIEQLAIDRAKSLFNCQYANVQSHSGSQANQAVFFAFLKPGDKILGMDLSAGGHLTHGSKVNLSGKWFEAHFYPVRKDNHLIDYDALEAQAIELKPKLLIAGASAYSRKIDFKRFREIADKAGCLLMADMAHYSGLIAAGVYPSPVPYADFCTSTTHKTLRGPRSGIILWNNPDYTKKINSAVFPALQGGPLMHIIAAKAVAFKEAASDEFKSYCQKIIINMHAIIEQLDNAGFKIVSGGSDCHVALVDLRPHNLKGNDAEHYLEQVGITLNKNAIPFDTQKPTITSGIRIGTAAITTRGFTQKECSITGKLIVKTLLALSQGKLNEQLINEISEEVKTLTNKFPIYIKDR